MPTRQGPWQFFTTRFYFSFLLTKNIEVVHCRQSVWFPVWVQTSMLCYNIPPQCLGDKGRASPTHPPSAPGATNPKMGGGVCPLTPHRGTGGWGCDSQPGGDSRGLCSGAASSPPHTLRGPPRSIAGLRAQSQHQAGNQLHATGEFLPGQGLVLCRQRLKHIPRFLILPPIVKHGQQPLTVSAVAGPCCPGGEGDVQKATDERSYSSKVSPAP